MPISTVLTPLNAFGKAFASGKIAEKNTANIQMWDQMLAENRDNKIKHYDYSKSHIIWSVEQSLKNLKTDYLDVFLLHRPSH
jgi:predicted oxidoreductase